MSKTKMQSADLSAEPQTRESLQRRLDAEAAEELKARKKMVQVLDEHIEVVKDTRKRRPDGTFVEKVLLITRTSTGYRHSMYLGLAHKPEMVLYLANAQKRGVRIEKVLR